MLSLTRGSTEHTNTQVRIPIICVLASVACTGGIDDGTVGVQDNRAKAEIRFLHSVTGVSAIQVRANGSVVAAALNLGEQSDYVVVPVDADVEVRDISDIGFPIPLVSARLALGQGEDHTGLVAGFDTAAVLSVTLDLLATPDPGFANIRVMHGAAEAGELVFAVQLPGAVSPIPFPTSFVAGDVSVYVPGFEGTYQVLVFDPFTLDEIDTSDPILLDAGESASVVVQDGLDTEVQFEALVDTTAN